MLNFSANRPTSSSRTTTPPSASTASLTFDHEGTVRSAFQSVLRGYGKKLEWTLAPEYANPRVGKGKRIVVDGALLDDWKFRHGFWEAKDEHDDLEREIKRKIEKGYPRSNIIFQAPERAILYQHGVRQGLNEDISDPKNLSDPAQRVLRLPRARSRRMGSRRQRV